VDGYALAIVLFAIDLVADVLVNSNILDEAGGRAIITNYARTPEPRD
jgi:hypothetical protein